MSELAMQKRAAFLWFLDLWPSKPRPYKRRTKPNLSGHAARQNDFARKQRRKRGE